MINQHVDLQLSDIIILGQIRHLGCMIHLNLRRVPSRVRGAGSLRVASKLTTNLRLFDHL